MSISPKLIIGNWKMHGRRREALTYIRTLRQKLSHIKKDGYFELVICLPATLLWSMFKVMDASCSVVSLGGQDCHAYKQGAFTGDIAASMLVEVGCRYVLVGHSERRCYHHEDDTLIAAKVVAALAAGLRVILCVGETDVQRRAGRAFEVIAHQLGQALPWDETDVAERIVVAYEPIWAIGSDNVATPHEIKVMHRHIASILARRWGGDVEGDAAWRIIYGGSVTHNNAATLLSTPYVDGVLVGRASLDVEEFWQIAMAAVPP